MQLNITDGGNNLLTSENYNMKWGGTANVPSSDSKLPYDVNVDFLKSQKEPSRKLRPRIGGPVQMANWQAWILSITAGSTTWDSKDTDQSKLPNCKVGGWDNGNFGDFLDGIMSLGADQLAPVSQSPTYLLQPRQYMTVEGKEGKCSGNANFKTDSTDGLSLGVLIIFCTKQSKCH